MSQSRTNPRPILAALSLVLALSLAGCGSDSTKSPGNPDPPDESAPLPPQGMHVDQSTTTKFLLSWSANPESDLKGYHVYLYNPDPSRRESYTRLTGSSPTPRTALSVPGTPGMTYTLRLTAVDQDSNESAMSDIFDFLFLPSEGSTEEVGNTGDQVIVNDNNGERETSLPMDVGTASTSR